MRTLTIDTESLESAQAFLTALGAFPVSLVVAHSGRYEIVVEIAGDRAEMQVLNAIEHHVTQHGVDPAVVVRDGHRHAIHAASALAVPQRDKKARPPQGHPQQLVKGPQ